MQVKWLKVINNIINKKATFTVAFLFCFVLGLKFKSFFV